MPGVFISYRRSDAQDVAGRIFDHIAARFSRSAVFKDVDSIPLGVRFPAFLEHALRDSDAVLVLIGPTWLTCRDDAGRARLDDPQDFVRREVETALRLGTPTVPVTVSNAQMPSRSELPEPLRPLAERNGQAVRPDPDFHRDMDRLIQHLVPLVNCQTDATRMPLDRDLLEKLLQLTLGWYNEVIQTAAQLEGTRDRKDTRKINFLYVNTWTFLPQILSIRKLLPSEGEGVYLARGIDQLVQLLAHIRDGEGSSSLACRPALLRRDNSVPHGFRVNDPKQLLAVQIAVQTISDEITRLLSKANKPLQTEPS
jgi:hypothetical protein